MKKEKKNLQVVEDRYFFNRFEIEEALKEKALTGETYSKNDAWGVCFKIEDERVVWAKLYIQHKKGE